MRNAIAIILTCFFGAACIAQEQDAPKSLVGFLKPGMHIGVVSYPPDSDRITIEIYSEQDHAIAIDSRNLTLEELTSKYERVATELVRTRKDILTSLQSSAKDIPPGKVYGEPEISLRTNQRESFYKIAATGDDYLLVTNATSPTKRRVLATRFISSINWRDELPFTWSVPHIDKTKDRTTR